MELEKSSIKESTSMISKTLIIYNIICWLSVYGFNVCRDIQNNVIPPIVFMLCFLLLPFITVLPLVAIPPLIYLKKINRIVGVFLFISLSIYTFVGTTYLAHLFSQ